MNNIYYTPLVVAAISAAVLASLTSIPIAFAGGLGLGVLQQILSIYLPTNSVLATNLRPSLPFVVLFLILIFSPSLRNRRDLADPLAGVAPPPPQPVAQRTQPGADASGSAGGGPSCSACSATTSSSTPT